MVDSQCKWYVLRTLPNAEKKVHHRLTKLGIEAFLPLYDKIVQWSDRKKKLKVPLFNGYVFAYLDQIQTSQVFEVPGFYQFLTTEGKRDVVTSEEIERIQWLIEGKAMPINCEYEPGSFVLISEGPFKGFEGQLVRVQGKDKVLLRVDAINQEILLEIFPGQLTISDEKFVLSA